MLEMFIRYEVMRSLNLHLVFECCSVSADCRKYHWQHLNKSVSDLLHKSTYWKSLSQARLHGTRIINMVLSKNSSFSCIQNSDMKICLPAVFFSDDVFNRGIYLFHGWVGRQLNDYLDRLLWQKMSQQEGGVFCILLLQRY